MNNKDNNLQKDGAKSNKVQQPLMGIRPDMDLESRDDWQHSDALYIDKFLMRAFTASTQEEARNAKDGLYSLQEQCLLHMRSLSELETVLRKYQDKIGYDHDEVAFNELMSFLSSVGASLAGVTHQLGFTYALSEVQGAGREGAGG